MLSYQRTWKNQNAIPFLLRWEFPRPSSYWANFSVGPASQQIAALLDLCEIGEKINCDREESKWTGNVGQN
jgi:hypothetical protein